MIKVARCLIVLVWALVAVAPAQAEGRIALVIGNDDYAKSNLTTLSQARLRFCSQPIGFA